MTEIIHDVIIQHQILQQSLEKNKQDLLQQKVDLKSRIQDLQKLEEVYQEKHIDEDIDHRKIVEPPIVKDLYLKSIGKLDVPFDGSKIQF